MTQKNELKALIEANLNLIYAMDEEALKEWIYEKYPRGYGLFDL